MSLGGSVNLNLFGESDDESYDDESDDESLIESDDESYAERSPFRVGRPRNYGRVGRGLSGGTMALPSGGNANVRFSKAVVSQQDFKRAMNMVRSDIRRNQRAIVKLDKGVTKKVKGLSSRMEQSSMLPLMLSFMQPRQDIASITISSGQTFPTGGPTSSPTVFNVDSTTPKAQTDTMLPMMLMMMMMGGMGGGLSSSSEKAGGSSQMMMMMMMMIALQPKR